MWGSCQGSGKTPYRVAVDTFGPSYTCTCPSRKFPCKHVLGLLYLWAEGRIELGGGISSYAAEWAAKRETVEKNRPSPEPARELTDAQVEAAEKRAAQRDERVRTGMVELNRWLVDQVTAGVAATTKGGYRAASEMAARMVDAQAPGVASRLRSLALIPSSGRDWPERLVDQLGLLRLLAEATFRLDELDEELRQTVRDHLGYTTARADVLGSPPATDRWVVVGMRDSDEEQVSLRRVWLRGVESGRVAQVLLFTPYGGQVDTSLLPGMVVEGDVHYYPGRTRLRAIMGRRGCESPLTDWEPDAWTVSEAAAAWRQVIADDPWLSEYPALVCGTAVAPRVAVSAAQRHADQAGGPRPAAHLGGPDADGAPLTGGNPWCLVDAAGDALPLVGTETDLWHLLAVTGGRRYPVFGELSTAGLRPTSVVVDGRLVTL